MNRQRAIEELKHAQYVGSTFEGKHGDVESAHIYADEIICKLLISLGYEDVVDEFHKVERWYA